MKGNNQQNPNEALLREVMEQYVSQLNSQRESFPIIMNSLAMKVKVCASKIDKFIKDNNVQIDESDDTMDKMMIPIQHYHKVRLLQCDLDNSLTALKLIPKNIVVALVSIYDAYVGNLLKILYRVKPELLNSCNKDISYTDILQFNSIDEIKERFIEKEVECVLRDSHFAQLEWLSKKFGIKLTEGFAHLKDFIEITERRNLFVHADGKVNRQYMSICQKHGIPIGNMKIGDEMPVTVKYVWYCYDILFETGIKLGQVLWRKIKIGLDVCDEQLQDVTYDLIKGKQYTLASVLLDFATAKNIKHIDKEMELVFFVNKALSYYLQGKQDETTHIVMSIDWSAYDNKYKLAKEVLLENNEAAAIIMKKIGKDETFISHYRTWPLFQKFRETEIFKKTYQEIYDIDFQYEEIEKIKWEEVVREAQDFIGSMNSKKAKDR